MFGKEWVSQRGSKISEREIKRCGKMLKKNSWDQLNKQEKIKVIEKLLNVEMKNLGINSNVKLKLKNLNKKKC